MPVFKVISTEHLESDGRKLIVAEMKPVEQDLSYGVAKARLLFERNQMTDHFVRDGEEFEFSIHPMGPGPEGFVDREKAPPSDEKKPSESEPAKPPAA